MYNIMFVLGLVMAIIFLTSSIILFFRNDVPKLMGDILGWNAKKTIRHMRNKDKIIPSKRKVNEQVVDLSENRETKLLTEEAITRKLYTENETGLLSEEENPMPAIFEVLEDIIKFHNS